MSLGKRTKIAKEVIMFFEEYLNLENYELNQLPGMVKAVIRIKNFEFSDETISRLSERIIEKTGIDTNHFSITHSPTEKEWDGDRYFWAELNIEVI